MTALENTITEVATRCLRGGIRVRQVGAAVELETPFDLLGLDSLATIELAAALEDELGFELPDDLISDCHDVRALARKLSALGPKQAKHSEDPFEQMLADAELPRDLRSPAVAQHADRGLRHARTILLTGSTGFLGSAILRDLLETSNASVICVVRSTSAPLAVHGGSRVRVVVGDIALPRLGLDAETYDGIARDVDAVVHVAASVNWVQSYASLRAANVTGTLELLRVAVRAGASFHFVSSLSTCYSTSGPVSVDEGFEPLPHIRGIHLGYAQTKTVAESLVCQAAQRGLPVRIYRPALISGHSRTGAFNHDDVITRLISGCVRMGTAPDLDWKLDAIPVDEVARSIVDLSASDETVLHLGHPRPRHWRECVLWMRMYGYDLTLVSYHAWLRQLERETVPSAEGAADHPLRPLRSFFLHCPATAGGLTLPELYEERRRTSASSARTQEALAAKGHEPVPLDAALLDTYFGAFRAAGQLPPPPNDRPKPRASMSLGRQDPLDTSVLSRVLDRHVRDVTLLSSGSEHSIVSELTAWRAGRKTGLFRARLQMNDGAQDVFIKVKPEDTEVIAVGQALADLVDPAVSRAYQRHAERAGFAASHLREIALYRQTDPRITAHLPRVLGTLAESSTGTWIAVLEDLSDGAFMNSADDPRRWGHREIDAAIDGLAALHSVWLGRETELRIKPWIGHVPHASSMRDMTDLWSALADHAAPAFSGWADPGIVAIHQRLSHHAADWWQVLDEGPRTLIHNDFNPRNICLRRPADSRTHKLRLCAYDWELATVGAPQRDLAEFLCFVLTPATIGDAPMWVERHRLALERALKTSIDAVTWTRGFGSALYDLLVNRLATYAMVHRVRPQSFLPRVVATWRLLYDLYPWEERP
jgi:thioester reductase-like protein